MAAKPRDLDIEFIYKSSTPEPNTGCLLWTMALNADGYGVTSSKYQILRAHRVVWELTNGQIPQGKQINHKCNVRACVNINHLYLGSQKENMQDKVKLGRAAAQKITHCPVGHKYEESNIIWEKNGKHRRCKKCRSKQRALYHLRNKNV